MNFCIQYWNKGGVKEPMEMFINFRGRKPSIDALLKHSGISA